MNEKSKNGVIPFALSLIMSGAWRRSLDVSPRGPPKRPVSR